MKVFEKKIKKAQELKAEEETRLRLDAAVAYKEWTLIKHFYLRKAFDLILARWRSHWATQSIKL